MAFRAISTLKGVGPARIRSDKVDLVDRPHDGKARRQGRQQGNDDDNAEDTKIAGVADGEGTEQSGRLIRFRGCKRLRLPEARQRKGQRSEKAAGAGALQTDSEKVLLEFGGDETRFRSDEMKDLDDVAIAGQRAAGGETTVSTIAEKTSTKTPVPIIVVVLAIATRRSTQVR